ncbi:MAG: oxidoreductase [Acidobacteria bacterium]|nr:oxidoreductase [Acidobacteriota bacterium]
MRLRFLVSLLLLSLPAAAQIKVGLIGLDTSHVIAFTKILNDPSNPNHVPGAKIVAAYKGGSPDITSSRERVDGYTNQLQEEFGVEIVADIPTLCKKVDAILLESVDGRKHLEQVKPVFEAGKRVFIDKPLAASLADVMEIARLGKKHNVPWWSSSSLRYSPAAKAAASTEGLTGAITWGPAPLEPTHELDLSWYGIHPVELLFSVMGPGCKRVTRIYTEGADGIIGEWKDGRLGMVRTIREGKSSYGVTAFGSKGVMTSTDAGAQYAVMLGDVVEFFKTGKPPVAESETIEIFKFMDAALRSKKAGGKPVDLE